MIGICRTLLAAAIVAALFIKPLSAQDFDWEFDEDSKLNTNLGFPVSVPVGSTSELTTFGTGVVGGAGYNFNQHHAFVGEFMWNWLYPTDSSLSPLQAALQSSELNGHSNLFVLTANYRLEVRGRKFGTYFIGGGGLYYRNATLSHAVTPLAGTPCTQLWQWWGFHCSSGTVVVSQTRTGFSSSIFGGNAGMGVTIHVGEPRYRLYFEARYHYAPDTDTNFILRFIPVTVGIRF